MAAWSFMRHLPGGEALRNKVRDGGLLPQGKKGDKEAYTVLYSDVAAIIWFRGGSGLIDRGSEVGGPSAKQIADWVPVPTALRWARLCKIQTVPGQPVDCEKLAKRMVQILSLKLDGFRVTANERSEVIDEHAYVQVYRDANFEKPGSSRATRVERCASWLGTLPVLHSLDQNVKLLEDLWQMNLNKERIMLVAQAVERGESLHLCGGTQALGDQLRMDAMKLGYATAHGPGGTTVEGTLNAMRDKDGLEPDWLLCAVAESLDESGGEAYAAGLELGQTMRLVTQCAAQLAGLDGGGVDSEGRRLPAYFTERTWERFAQRCGPPLVSEPHSLFPFTPSGLFKNAEDCFLSLYADSKHMGQDGVISRVLLACMPIVVEALLQYAARLNPPLTCEALTGDLLWQYVGWDSPHGRRLLRRLVRAFDRYAGGTEITQSVFNRLTNDAGWATSRDVSTKHARFVEIFGQAAVNPGAETLDLIDFIYVIELTAAQIVRPRLTPEGNADKVPLWSAIESACNSVGGQGGATSSRTRGAMTVKKPPPGVRQNSLHMTPGVRQNSLHMTARTREGSIQNRGVIAPKQWSGEQPSDADQAAEGRPAPENNDGGIGEGPWEQDRSGAGEITEGDEVDAAINALKKERAWSSEGMFEVDEEVEGDFDFAESEAGARGSSLNLEQSRELDEDQLQEKVLDLLGDEGPATAEDPPGAGMA